MSAERDDTPHDAGCDCTYCDHNRIDRCDCGPCIYVRQNWGDLVTRGEP